MKQAAVQNSAARSAAVNSPLNDRGRADTLLSHGEPNTQRWGPAALEQRRERTRDHLAKIAGRRETWIKRSRHHYGLLNRLLRFLMEPQKSFSQFAAYVRQSGRSYWIPVHGRTILRQTD
jgi:hypothetical protein